MNMKVQRVNTYTNNQSKPKINFNGAIKLVDPGLADEFISNLERNKDKLFISIKPYEEILLNFNDADLEIATLKNLKETGIKYLHFKKDYLTDDEVHEFAKFEWNGKETTTILKIEDLYTI